MSTGVRVGVYSLKWILPNFYEDVKFAHLPSLAFIEDPKHCRVELYLLTAIEDLDFKSISYYKSFLSIFGFARALGS